ncbi:MAG: hypothetical protein CMJ81_10850 [Planctomycetaceae bacterium]|nr:hypothetical protein [Planctomycetaceae bacterium]
MTDESNLEEEPVIVLFGLLIVLASTFLVISLAIKVFSTGIGILLGLLTLVPCIGLLGLLLVNIRATRVLRQNGIHVGFFGAKRFET